MMGYAVKANDFVRDVVIHEDSCSQVEKGGGPPGKYGQVHWKYFDTLDAAEKYAQKWQAKGYTGKYCSFCFKFGRLTMNHRAEDLKDDKSS